MKLDIKNKNDYSRSLSIVVPWDDVKENYYKEFNKAKSKYQIAGFRKGKVPDNIVRKNLLPSIDAQFVDHYVNFYYREALQELKLVPINQGQITKVDFKEFSNLEFEINFEVRPEIKLPKYKNKVTIKTNKYIAGDKDLEDSIKDLQTRFASSKTIEGAVSSGHFIYADFDKVDDNGDPIKGSTLKNHFVKIGEGLFGGDVGDKFIGKKTQDVVNVTIQQDSKPVNYQVTINKIEEQILPEVNDDFAKTVDPNISTIADLNKNLLEKIQDNLNQENIKEYHNKIIDYFIDKTKFDAPQSMIDNYKTYLIEDYKRQYAQMNQEFDESKIEDVVLETSTKTVKWILVRDLLLADEKINVDQSSVDSYIKEQMDKSPQYKKEIKKYYTDEKNKSKLLEDMTNQKLYESLEKYFVNKVKESSTAQLRKNKKG
tara:strand:+ start:753 stop:2036 length:1284 start_codon:yes stop_codon:yes gene_type:complete